MRGASSHAGMTTMTRDDFHMPAFLTALVRRPLVVLALAVTLLVAAGSSRVTHRPFPPDTTPEGAYARIALAIAERHPERAFAYLETEAQWAAFTLHDARKQAFERARSSYPPEERERVLMMWQPMAQTPDGAGAFAELAAQRGWIARLERDLSGVAHVGNRRRPGDGGHRPRDAIRVQAQGQRDLGDDDVHRGASGRGGAGFARSRRRGALGQRL